MAIKRGEIYLVDLTDALGSEQSGVRPAVIVQNDIGNSHSPTTLIVPLTSKTKTKMSPTHVTIRPEDGVKCVSEAECEQARVADQVRLKRYIGTINNEEVLKEINQKLMVAFGLQ